MPTIATLRLVLADALLFVAIFLGWTALFWVLPGLVSVESTPTP